MRILFTGGGTGGHTYPIIAVLRELKQAYAKSSRPIGLGKESGLELYFLGANHFIKPIKKEGAKVKIITAGKIRRYFSIYNFLDIFKMPFGFLKALWYLYIWMPDVVFNKGGYGGAPVVLAAWLFRIPVLTHESDTIPGLANRLAGKFSKKIAVSFRSTLAHFPGTKTALIGNPIRLALIEKCLSNSPQDKEKAKNIFKTTGQKPVIFIVGGSQGSQKINEIVLSVLPRLLEKYEIIHQCGEANRKNIAERIKQMPENYHLYPFLNEEQMQAAYLLANLVIARAGAGTISEIAACAKPSILIPLANSASGHQRENAFTYAQTGATVVIEQSNLTPNIFLNEVYKILDNPELIQRMSQSANNFSRPEAARKLAEALIEMGE